MAAILETSKRQHGNLYSDVMVRFKGHEDESIIIFFSFSAQIDMKYRMTLLFKTHHFKSPLFIKRILLKIMFLVCFETRI